MSDQATGPNAGTFSVTAHDRVMFGTPAGEAVLAQAVRYGANAAHAAKADLLVAVGSGAAASNPFDV